MPGCLHAVGAWSNGADAMVHALIMSSASSSSSSPPPDHPDSAAAGSSYPAWVLLDKKTYIADHENATTATATSSTGHTVKVTFCLTDPPAVSHFCVHGPADHLVTEPRVVSSEKDLVLLSFVFAVGDGHEGYATEYFIYKAGRGKPPPLHPIPASPPETTCTLYVNIVPRDDDGEFFLADLFPTTTLGSYDVTIFSSRTAKWTFRRLELHLHTSTARIKAEDLFVVAHKAIALGGGLVGWVDLWRGIILFNVLIEEPFIYYIPLPKPNFNLFRTGDPRPVRDVICHDDGVIKFVEMDHVFRNVVVRPSKRFKVTEDLDGVDRMYDQEILLLPQESFLEGPGEQQVTSVPDGWKIRTRYRRTTWDHWRKGHTVHVDDILANRIGLFYTNNNPKHSGLSPQISPLTSNLNTAYPILSLHGDDVVYLMSKAEFHDKNAWIVGVHLGNKTVEIVEPYVAERITDFNPDCLPYAFSDFLNTTPRLSAEEPACASNEAQNRHHLSSGRSSGHADREAPGNGQHQPPLLSNMPQPLHMNLNSSGSGRAHPVNSQSMYPDPVVSRDANGQLWLAVPLVGNLLSQLLQLAGARFTPQNSVAQVQANAAPALQPKDGSPNASTQLENPDNHAS
ncbi:unnamed protein product [Alopecurus aequalis]